MIHRGRKSNPLTPLYNGMVEVSNFGDTPSSDILKHAAMVLCSRFEHML
tara:strand:- start:1 stop:147 length:147 start_codon:yes stop_codon:yes gene_type:complete